ncbi:1-deoxy-D-xylulose-5-phosphate reductoisomerase [bacterium]|nr:MAG: 1-deoxy-D-xylulose-5-phosphate reductoisomerase [bacterium]
MTTRPRPLVILGATGSIGQSTLDLVRRYPERFTVTALSARRRGEELAKLAEEFPQAALHLADTAARDGFIESHPQLKARLHGDLEDLYGIESGALVVNGLVGAAGLAPTVNALERGLDVALANKEALVVGGQLVLDAAQRGGARLWPVDSEHSAIAQCLRGNPQCELSKIWLTASGGPFRDHEPAALASVSLAEVLDHPTWDMGPKVTVDSASMMNKGLEILEAHWLFGVQIADIEVVIHRESIVHSFVEFRDGVFLAQMGAPDMRLPILFALSGGEHLACDAAPWSPLQADSLHFAAPDPALYPCLELARAAGRSGASAPIVLNAANEVAVAALLAGELEFTGIPPVIDRALQAHQTVPVGSVEEALDLDARTRISVRESILGKATS